MNLLGWAATFGAEPALDAALAEPRADADAAASGVWVVARSRDARRALLPRVRVARAADADAPERARALFKTAAEAYRATDNRDVLPVALGFWAEAERRSGSSEAHACSPRKPRRLIEQGAPSLLNESPVFLALHDAYLAAGDDARAVEAVQRGMGPLTRRLQGLKNTPYARVFLTRAAAQRRARSRRARELRARSLPRSCRSRIDHARNKS